MAAVKTVQDARDRKSDYDLQRVDFDWVSKTEDRRELGKAIEALREDGGFPHLLKAAEERLALLDPAFKRKLDSMIPVSVDQKRAIDADINSFLLDMDRVDKKLQSATDGELYEGSKENRSNNRGGAQSTLSKQIEEIEKKKQAENERFKGNECMKAKDFTEAILCYGKALEIHPEDAPTYSNRALAYLKTKEYARALEDADTAIKLKSDYLKAYHRRGKAYAALNKLELAIRDF